MKIALLCSGLGVIRRGHEVFARDLFNLVSDVVDITLFKGGGEVLAKELVIDNVNRDSPCLSHIHVSASPLWCDSIKEQERYRIEAETFAYGALKPLLEGEYDIIHCLEREVCDIIYDHRYFFKRIPKIIFSNGGAIPAWDLPRCDYVQEHTEHNFRYSATQKAFMIPHGVDLQMFNPQVQSDLRSEFGIPDEALVVISVGTICYHHKRMDYVIQELASLNDPNLYLLIVGQESKDAPEIKAMGKKLFGNRIIFASVPHEELPKYYAIANVFVLGSLFETFGIVYIEAMSMGLPVICSKHVNQRSIVKEGIFIDMSQDGELANTFRHMDVKQLQVIGQRGRQIVTENYDLTVLKQKYVERYQVIAAEDMKLPTYGIRDKLVSNLRNLYRRTMRSIYGSARS